MPTPEEDAITSFQVSFHKLSVTLREMDSVLEELDENSRLCEPNAEEEAKMVMTLGNVRKDLLIELPEFKRLLEVTGGVSKELIQDVESGVQRLWSSGSDVLPMSTA